MRGGLVFKWSNRSDSRDIGGLGIITAINGVSAKMADLRNVLRQSSAVHFDIRRHQYPVCEWTELCRCFKFGCKYSHSYRFRHDDCCNATEESRLRSTLNVSVASATSTSLGARIDCTEAPS